MCKPNPEPTRPRKPPWLRITMPTGRRRLHLKELKNRKSLHTVCEEAMCPNLPECWESGHATFLILGAFCTRDCRFCAVRTARPGPIDEDEPRRVAEAVAKMGLRHVVVTSVTRDDLPDGGASLFAETIRQIRYQRTGCTVEVLIPDFKGDPQALERVLETRPQILGHNVETVPRLYQKVRPGAIYQRSLGVLRLAKEMDQEVLSKSGIMVGLGETTDEVLKVMEDLRGVGCDILTIGQYLRPGKGHLPVVRYYGPEEFLEIKRAGYTAGFRWVESGPLVRSSYRSEFQVRGLLHKDGGA